VSDWSPAPVDVLGVFPEMRQRGVAMLRELTEAEWAAPTKVPGWTIHDIAVHLVGGLMANVSRRRDGHSGNFADFAPEEAALADPDGLVRTLNAWNEAWVVAGRRISPRMVVDLIDRYCQELEEYFGTIDLFAMGDAVGWAGSAPAPVWLDVAREYTEVWSHLAQIREAAGRPLVDAPYLFAPVLDAFAWGIPHALRMIERPEGSMLKVVATGAAGGEWWVRRESDGWGFAPADAGEPDATVTVGDEMMWRLAMKSLHPDVARGEVWIEGDRELGEGFLRLVSILA
jgi:hypothetical protein